MARLSPPSSPRAHDQRGSSAASSSSSSSSAAAPAHEGASDDERQAAAPRKRRRVSPARSAAAVKHAAASPLPRRTASAPTRRKRSVGAAEWAFLDAAEPHVQAVAVPPLRVHARSYHAPLLLAPPSTERPDGAVLGRAARSALLGWYDGVAQQRAMPWRKPFLDPAAYIGREAELRAAQTQRAYEIWISEIMLQQTRVETVIPYFERWLAAWPTVRDLAAASTDDVLAVWKGLGYYSRATRLQSGAQKLVADPELRGLLPRTAHELVAVVPGVGPYTAGAISAIAFGEAAPMVDGNVQRVLSRQLGLYASMKSSATTQLLTEVASRLVRAVAEDGEPKGSAKGSTPKPSDRPGRWGQALMELGA
jgi:A/G-specific adenine glycosylase